MNVDQVHLDHLLCSQIHRSRIVVIFAGLDQTAVSVVLADSDRLYLRLIDVSGLMIMRPALMRVDEIVRKLFIQQQSTTNIFAWVSAEA